MRCASYSIMLTVVLVLVGDWWPAGRNRIRYSTAERPWPPAVPENTNREELNNLGPTERKVDDIVAFLRTLTDGFEPKLASR
mgnify:CR=1 FL=1